MKKKAKKEKRKFSPILTITFITLVIMIMSLIFSILGIEGQKTVLVNGNLETSLVTVKNIFTKDGLNFLIGDAVLNFTLFEPLVILIISLIGISIGEASGLFKAIFSPLKKLNLTTMTFLTLLISLISGILGELAYVIVLPLVGVIYKYANKNSMLGICTAFLGITVGYGTNFIYDYDTYLLGTLTQASATADVDKNFVYHLLSTEFIMIASTLLICVLGTLIINRFLAPKFKKKAVAKDDLELSKKALRVSAVVFVLCVLLIVYMIIPGLPGSGLLLDRSKDEYVAQLLGTTSPFRNGIIYLLTIITMICSYIYGRISKNFKDNYSYGLGLSKGFSDLGYLFVLMFFTSQMVAILSWTNLGEVVATRLISFMSSLEISGIPLILSMFIVIILIGIFIPSTVAKWELAAPTLIPLFMRSNITPNFTQFLFQAADGIGKCITPLFIYFIVAIGIVEKYNEDETHKVTIFGTLRKFMPSVLLFMCLWILILIGWYVIGLPMGPSTSPTL